MHTNTEIKPFKMADTKRTTGRFLEENLHVLRNLHGAIYRPDKTGQQIVLCKPVLKFKFYGIFLQCDRENREHLKYVRDAYCF